MITINATSLRVTSEWTYCDDPSWGRWEERSEVELTAPASDPALLRTPFDAIVIAGPNRIHVEVTRAAIAADFSEEGELLLSMAAVPVASQWRWEPNKETEGR